MGLIKRLFYKKDGTPTLAGKPLHKVIGPKRRMYKTHCLLKYNDEPIRKFETKVLAYSSQQAERKMKAGLSISIVKTYKMKKQ